MEYVLNHNFLNKGEGSSISSNNPVTIGISELLFSVNLYEILFKKYGEIKKSNFKYMIFVTAVIYIILSYPIYLSQHTRFEFLVR